MQPSLNTLYVLKVLLLAERPLYGREVLEKCEGLKEATVHFTLSRLAEEGWVKVRRTSARGIPEGGPRTFYELSARGRRKSKEIFERLFVGWRPDCG